MISCEYFHLNLFHFKCSDEKEEMLDGAESQNYGYGYGTKVSAKILHFSCKGAKMLTAK